LNIGILAHKIIFISWKCIFLQALMLNRFKKSYIHIIKEFNNFELSLLRSKYVTIQVKTRQLLTEIVS